MSRWIVLPLTLALLAGASVYAQQPTPSAGGQVEPFALQPVSPPPMPPAVTLTPPRPVTGPGAPAPGQASPSPAQPAEGNAAQVVPRIVDRAQLQIRNPALPDKPSVYNGTIVWRTGAHEANGTAIMGELVFPSARIKGQVSIRHNLDPSLGTEFTAQVKFDVPANFPLGKIEFMQAMTLSKEPGEIGEPLDGMLLRTEGGYLLGTADPFDEKGKEARLLDENIWFHIVLGFSGRKQAIVTFEKGRTGTHLFDAMMRQVKAKKP